MKTEACPDIELSDVSSQQAMEENGWSFSLTDSEPEKHSSKCGKGTWYGMSSGSEIGKVNTVFVGRGSATLVYGNCWTGYTVKVWLNNKKVSVADKNKLKKKVTFQFTKGDKLQIEEDGGIIKLHSLTISCGGKKTFILALIVKLLNNISTHL